MRIIAHTIIKILKMEILEGNIKDSKICCMNCLYYYVNDVYDSSSYCSIDKELIEPEISHIVKCKAFELWFGSM